MKVILKNLSSLLLGLGMLLSSGEARAYVYYTPEALLGELFPGGVEETVSWTPDAAQRAHIEAVLGAPLPKPTWEIVVGQGAQGTAWALLDQQKGQHEPIDFGVLLGAGGVVQRVEILVYREPYGDGVRSTGFRKQFLGLTAASPMRAGREIQIVSGSTLSTRAIATGVRRASAIVAEWLSAA